MLSREKVIVKAKISLALDKNDKEQFKRSVSKLESWFDKENFLKSINTTLGFITKKIKPKKESEKYLTILNNNLSDFYYQVIMIDYEINKDLNSALKRVDDLVSKESGRIKNLLLEHKLNYLLDYEGPDFLQEKVNEEISKVMNILESEG